VLVPSAPLPAAPLTARVRAYWNEHIHDLAITSHPVGSPGFFQDLDEYHFDKLHHLVQLVPFDGLRGKRVLDVGCGTGVDLVRFAQGGAIAIGVDLADSAITLARQNFAQRGLAAKLVVGDAERLPLADACVDYVFAHGVVQYTGDGQRVVDEVRRVLRPGGACAFTVPMIVGRLSRSCAGRAPSYHGTAADGDGYRVHTEFGADAWRWVIHAGFAECRIVAIDAPAAHALVGIR